jgi:putative ABC transport system permease protein
MSLMARHAGDPQTVAAGLKQAVYAVDKELGIAGLTTFDAVLADSLAERRVLMLLLSVFAGLALLLAAIGIYGVIAYSVSQRTREIGLRMALGARPRDALRLVIGEGMALTGAGIALGLAAALALTRWMKSLLFSVEPTDPTTFAGVALLLALVALMACVIPARRAARVDPMKALRQE